MLALFAAAGLLLQAPPDGNRLTHLDEADPYYPHAKFPKLATPQWVGEEGVEAAVILSIDDMRGPEKWEAYLRPILERLKKIDGRAPVSIMSCRTDPGHPHLQAWLKEGLSLETHTLDHPYPLLQKGDFAKAKANYDGGVDLLASVPGSRPVAFRMPWCDTLNTPSPRFYAEIFNSTTSKGNFLTIDSSVFNLITPEDPELPRPLVLDAEGNERYRRYLPARGSFVNYVRNYPYPYVVGRLCWEFPAVVPDDSQPFHRKKAVDPVALEDLKAALDATVLKQGVFTFVFHPYDWFKNAQIVDLIDHAVSRHGKKVKFLTFREAQERLDANLLAGHPLRAADGSDGGTRVLDLDGDGFLDVLAGRKTRLWRPKERRWDEVDLPFEADGSERFGVVAEGRVAALLRTETRDEAWLFDGRSWAKAPELLKGLELDGRPVRTRDSGRDRGVRLRDVERKGRCHLLVANEIQNAVFEWTGRGWKRLGWALPAGTSIVDAAGRDAGLRLLDLNGDGYDDVVFSGSERYSVTLFIPRPHALRAFPEMGWKRPALTGKRGDPGAIPAIAREGRNNGAWFHSGHLWVQNEDTSALPDHVDRRSLQELVVGWLPPPLSPEESLRAIRISPRFTVELVASEPLVRDPVAFEWGADGKLWVVEMTDYPLAKSGGRVRFLEDADGDGRYDKATTFLEGVPFPTGVLPWRRGVLVSAAPEVLYAEDTDGDGRADVRRTLLHGFGEGNQQHRVNGFQYGLDNWVYGANGGSGGTVVSRLTGQVARLGGRDFRFRPDTGAFEPQAGVTEFGRNRDDWGNWFGNNHPTWGWHYFLPEHYLARNPHLPVRTNKRFLGESSLAYRVSLPMARPQMARALNHSTAPCCLMPYRDELFGPDFESAIFIGEVDKNIVHRENLVADGVSFVSRRVPEEKEREFIASTDNWFRPTMTRTGPDGALYVADMYRLVIEHAEYYPPDVRDLIDFRAGHDRGRIYRVAPAGSAPRKIPRLDGLDAAGLAAALDSPNGWQRDTAQRLLVEKADRAAVGPLERLARECPRPKTRLQSLCTLEGLGGLTPELLSRALGDPHAAVREHAVRLSEGFLRRPEAHAALEGALLARAEDPSVRVRYQLAFTLGEWKDPRAAAALARLALEGGDLETAALSSAVPHAGEMLSRLLSADTPPGRGLVERLVAMAVALKHDAAVARALEGGRPAARMAAAAAYLDALEAAGTATPHAAVRPLLAEARRRAADPAVPVPDREQAVRLLGRGGDTDLEMLADLLRPQSPLQGAALERLKAMRGPRIAEVLLAGWKSYPPALRGRALQALLSRAEWMAPLLDAVEAERVAPGEIDLTQRQRLLGHSEAAIRERAGRVFSRAGADRQKVLAEYREVPTLKGDAARGAELYRKNCAACHRLRGEGSPVGPELTPYAEKPAQDIVIAILDPNQVVAGGYAGYLLELKDGRELSGVIASETASSLTLRVAGGAEEVVSRESILQLRSSGLSLMPEGFEKTLRPQDVADLVSFIASDR